MGIAGEFLFHNFSWEKKGDSFSLFSLSIRTQIMVIHSSN